MNKLIKILKQYFEKTPKAQVEKELYEIKQFDKSCTDSTEWFKGIIADYKDKLIKDYKLIDLGLPSGTLWMDRNIGATSPTDSGLYFAWGETQGYTADETGITKKFNWRGYKHTNGVYNKLTRYCGNPYYGNDGYTDSLVTLQSVDDAAYQFTYGKCQMPTKEQIQELIDNTTYEWTTQDGVNGGLLTSKTNGNSIFIPAAGFCVYSSVYVGEYCYLWSSSLYECNYGGAWDLHFGSKRVICGVNSRTGGFSVRGVKY